MQNHLAPLKKVRTRLGTVFKKNVFLSKRCLDENDFGFKRMSRCYIVSHKIIVQKQERYV